MNDHGIMKRKFIQGWPTIPPISTKGTTAHLNSLDELLTLPKHLTSPPVFSEVHVT
jgi:hypothetical protein